jgi:hypothetical protein
MASVIAAIASAGVAIGLALQGALSNLAGGIMILLFRPFRLDDYIEAGDYSGTVVDVGIFYTVLKTPDNKVVTSRADECPEPVSCWQQTVYKQDYRDPDWIYGGIYYHSICF